MLLDNFEITVSRAEDVGKLNGLILQLAVQGKLVAQDPDDEPASDLLKRIAAEKKRLKIKSQPLPEIGDEERPFALPDGWEWVRLGDIILNIEGGKTPSKRNPAYWDGDIAWASVKDLKSHLYLTTTQDRITQKAIDDNTSNLIPKGNVIVCTRMGLGKIVLNEIDVAINQDLKALTLPNEIDRLFFYYQYKTKSIQGSGMTVSGIRQEELLKIPFFLPPLAEQKRIVERVDALLAQTRELESRLSQAETSLTALHETAVNTLLSATDPDDFTVRWQFIAENFNLLYDETYPETALANVAALKQAILQLAVQGKLTRQYPSPRCVKLEEIISLMGGGTPSKRNPEYWDGNIPWISPKDMKKLDLIESIDHITEFAINSNAAKLIPINSVLIVVRGMILAHTVPAGVLRINAAINQDIKALIPDACVTPEYLRLLIWGHNPNILELVERSTHGTCKLKTPDLLNFEVLLPALTEQKHIVTRVNTLLRLCDELSAHIQAAQATRAALRDAVLSS